MKYNIYSLKLCLFVFLFVNSSIYSQENQNFKKIDFHLQLILGSKTNLIELRNQNNNNSISSIAIASTPIKVSEGVVSISVFIKIEENATNEIIEKYRLENCKTYQGTNCQYISAWINIEQILKLSSDQKIINIFPDQYLSGTTFESIPLTSANKVWNGNIQNSKYRIDGSKVYVGVIEIGYLRTTHEQFSNNNRIKHLWDIPNVYDGVDWNISLNSNDPENDHATHVTGIAAGQSTDKAVGMAHNSDILFARVRSVSDLYEALNQINTFVGSKTTPVNLSVEWGKGNYFIENIMADYIDILDNFLQDNPNIVLVAAASNNAINPKSHFAGKVPGNQGEYVDFTIDLKKDTSLYFTIYGDKKYSIQFYEKDGFNLVDSKIFKFKSGKVDTLVVKEFTNKDDSIFVHYDLTQNLFWVRFHEENGKFDKGKYKIRLYPAADGGGDFDVYLNAVDSKLWDKAFIENGDNYETIGFPGGSKEAITVASFDVGSGEISNFSSKGPLRGESLPSKPDIAAPGSNGSKSINSASIKGDKTYTTKQGTSMAAPHVTGGIALLLQNFPTLTSPEIKLILKNSTDPLNSGSKPKSFSEVASFGSGKLNILKAYKSLIGYDGKNLESPEVNFIASFMQFENIAGIPIDIIRNIAENSTNTFQKLSNGALFFNSERDKVFWIGEEIWNFWYNVLKGANSEIGLPIGSQYLDQENANLQTVQFEKCALFIDKNGNIQSNGNCLKTNLAFVFNDDDLIYDYSKFKINNLKIFNNGQTSITENIKVNFFLSEDEHIDIFDLKISDISISGLSKDESKSINLDINIQNLDFKIPPGNYYFGFNVDPYNEIKEFDELDNDYVLPDTKIEIADEEFSCINIVNISCGTSYEGKTVKGNYGAEKYGDIEWDESGPEVVHKVVLPNEGDMIANISNRTSKNSENENDFDVFILGECNKNTILAYDDKNAIIKNAKPGVYYIIVDGYKGDKGEYTLTVTCGNDKPNITFLSDKKISIKDNIVELDFTVVNSSCNIPASSFKINYSLSIDLYFDDADDYFLESETINGLLPQEELKVNRKLDISDYSLNDSQYYIYINLDYNNSIIESEEYDNYIIFKQDNERININRLSGPNLTIFHGHDKLVQNNEKIEQTGNYYNQGNTDINGEFETNFFLENIFNNDFQYDIKDITFSGILKANSTKNYTFSMNKQDILNSGVPYGLYHLYYTLDAYNDISETNGNDNLWYWPYWINYILIGGNPECNSTTYLDEEFGVVETENYKENSICQWIISPKIPTKGIELNFKKFKTEKNYDVLEIYIFRNGDYILLDRFSGQMQEFKKTYDYSVLYIRFFSDSKSNDEGFIIEYSAIQKGFCLSNITFTKPSGIIDDGSGCENYYNNTDCIWIIEPNEQNVLIELGFDEFDIADDDNIFIYDGSTIFSNIIGEFSGTNKPNSKISSTSNKLLVRFVSNEYNTRAGFVANYSTISDPDKDKNSIPYLKVFSVYPSISATSVAFLSEFSQAEDYEVSITNSLGQTISTEKYKGTGSHQFIDVSYYPSGNYYIFIRTKDGRDGKKFVVIDQ